MALTTSPNDKLIRDWLTEIATTTEHQTNLESKKVWKFTGVTGFLRRETVRLTLKFHSKTFTLENHGYEGQLEIAPCGISSNEHLSVGLS